MSDETDKVEYERPEYVGGDVAPADLWGKTPLRGQACAIVEQVMDGLGAFGEGRVRAFQVVDALIQAGLLPNELSGPRGAAR